MSDFKPMLADPPEEKYPLRFPFYASPKYDGIRCIITADGPVTRKLKLIPNRELRNALSHLIMSGFDGELLSGSPTHPNAMQATTSAVMSHEGDYSQVSFYVFDRLALGRPELGYEYRKHLLEGWFGHAAKICPVPLKLVPQILVHNQAELDSYVETCLLVGYEGVILRRPDGHYKYGRSTAKEQLLLKIKPWEDAEGTIIAFEEGETNTNEKTRDELGYAKRSSAQAGKVGNGTMGRAVVRISGWQSDTVRIGNGPGLTHGLRQEIWNNQAAWLGKTLKYKFQRVGSLDRPRIPQWLGIRHEDDMGEGEL